MANRSEATTTRRVNAAFTNPPETRAPEHRLGLDERKEKDVIDRLEQVLADSYALYLKTQNAHWNVTGPLFKPLHDLFEEQYIELAAAIDTLAERIRVFGRFVSATFRDFSDRTEIEEWDGPPSGDEMVRTLLRDNESVIGTLRALADAASANGDEATLDLVVERLRAHEKATWMLRAHLE
jgi:starvation-inducible DNA-binding protein